MRIVAIQSSCLRPSKHGVVNHQKHDRTHNSNKQAVKIQATYPAGAERIEQEPADNCSHNSEQNIDHNPLSPFIDKLAADKSSQQTQNHPTSMLLSRLNLLGFVRVASPVIPPRSSFIPWRKCSVSSVLLKHLVKIAQGGFTQGEHGIECASCYNKLQL